MAAGAPILARDTVHSREVLGPDAGDFTGPAPETSRGRSAVSRHPQRQQQLSAAAVQRARAAYSWESVNAAYERLLRSHLTSAGDRMNEAQERER